MRDINGFHADHVIRHACSLSMVCCRLTTAGSIRAQGAHHIIEPLIIDALLVDGRHIAFGYCVPYRQVRFFSLFVQQGWRTCISCILPESFLRTSLCNGIVFRESSIPYKRVDINDDVHMALLRGKKGREAHQLCRH